MLALELEYEVIPTNDDMIIIASVCSVGPTSTICIRIYSTLALSVAKALIHTFITLHRDDCSSVYLALPRQI